MAPLRRVVTSALPAAIWDELDLANIAKSTE